MDPFVFEGVTQHQQLRLGIDGRAPVRRVEPGASHLDPAILPVDPQVSRHPYDPVVGEEPGRKRKVGTGGLGCQEHLDQDVHILERTPGPVPKVLPDLGVARRAAQALSVFLLERDEFDVRAR
jgi:hypothetical protein